MFLSVGTGGHPRIPTRLSTAYAVLKSVHDARADELGDDSAAPSRFPTDKSVGGDASSSIGSTREPHLLARTKHVYYRDQPHGYRRSCCGGPRRRRASRWCVPRPRPRSAHRRIAAVALTFAPIVFLPSVRRESGTVARALVAPARICVSCRARGRTWRSTGDRRAPSNAAATRRGDFFDVGRLLSDIRIGRRSSDAFTLALRDDA